MGVRSSHAFYTPPGSSSRPVAAGAIGFINAVANLGSFVGPSTLGKLSKGDRLASAAGFSTWR